MEIRAFFGWGEEVSKQVFLAGWKYTGPAIDWEEVRQQAYRNARAMILKACYPEPPLTDQDKLKLDRRLFLRHSLVDQFFSNPGVFAPCEGPPPDQFGQRDTRLNRIERQRIRLSVRQPHGNAPASPTARRSSAAWAHGIAGLLRAFWGVVAHAKHAHLAVALFDRFIAHGA